MSKYKLYINDILRAINLIEKTTKGKNLGSFSKDKNLVDATAMRVQIIGESIKKLPKIMKDKLKSINVVYLEGLRNIISHTYFKINPELLWSIVDEEIPNLKKEIKKLQNVR